MSDGIQGNHPARQMLPGINDAKLPRNSRAMTEITYRVNLPSQVKMVCARYERAIPDGSHEAQCLCNVNRANALQSGQRRMVSS
eukprot:scaffold1639_cov331-Pavlova_lutheri.AAC.14